MMQHEQRKTYFQSKIDEVQTNKNICKKREARLPNIIKSLVSKQKRRFQQNGFNLDLTYITEKIIAMGYPTEGNIEKIYRNSLSETQRYPLNIIYRFLNTYHKDHYKIYNLCCEPSRRYSESVFNICI